jgi:hypothetical protein
MKEDILEQLVDDYLQSEGYFTRHNIKFKPRPDHPDFIPRKDSNHSDIDVIGLHPKKIGADRIWVVSCKSWQSGFHVQSKLVELEKNKIISGREAWQSFRELVKPKWSEAFINSVDAATGTREFTYVLAVTAIFGDRKLWENHHPFIQAMGGNPIRLIELSEILDHLQKVSTTTVASSDIGRVLQLMRASQKGKKELLKVVESQNEIH